jgi:uncharacterized protein (UPF0332 family)
MKNRQEVVLKVRKYFDLEIVIADASRKDLANLYIQKARHNLLVAGYLRKADFAAWDWVINTSYYAMYMAAQCVLAAIGIKCDNHTATPYVLEYYFVFSEQLEQKYVDLLKNMVTHDDIVSLKQAKKYRIEAQYAVTESMGKKKAEKLLTDAGSFVNRMEVLLGSIQK